MQISGELIVWAASHLDLKTPLGCVISGHSYYFVSNLLTRNLHLQKKSSLLSWKQIWPKVDLKLCRGQI